MNDRQSFQKFVGIVAILSFFTAIASDVLQGIPVHFSPDIAADPNLFLSAGPAGAGLLRWGLILDMFGYYLPLLPVILFIQELSKKQAPNWIGFSTICGMAYVFIGAVGAVVLAVVQPSLINAYAGASTDQQGVLQAIFGTLWTMIYAGLWNILGELLIGIWFVTSGVFPQSEQRIIGILSIVVGLAALLDAIGNMIGLESLALIGLSGFLILAPVWMLWFGIDLLRSPLQTA